VETENKLDKISRDGEGGLLKREGTDSRGVTLVGGRPPAMQPKPKKKAKARRRYVSTADKLKVLLGGGTESEKPLVLALNDIG